MMNKVWFILSRREIGGRQHVAGNLDTVRRCHTGVCFHAGSGHFIYVSANPGLRAKSWLDGSPRYSSGLLRSYRGRSAGLAALLHHAPVLYSFLRLAGAFYMLWLGGRMMFASVAHDATEIPSRHRRVLRDSIVVEILNPKTALFFLTFLPQFVDPQGAMPSWLQFLLLGIIVNGAFSLGDLASVAIASFASPRISSSGFADWIPRVSGGVLVGLSAAIMMHFI
ncbi:LysE family translocator [Brucella sp. RRSP16]|uniref:LysE family translocator n=1 Tax=Brucella sp. RRSP16 TaxID=3453707 RepID=UPI003FCDD9F2